jgi:hypothetical protein
VNVDDGVTEPVEVLALELTGLEDVDLDLVVAALDLDVSQLLLQLRLGLHARHRSSIPT